MITELEASEFHKIKHLTNACRNMEVKAVASGMNPGRVYVDDTLNPQAALVWVQGQSGYQLIADFQNEVFRSELREYMETQIYPTLASLQISDVEIGVEDSRWEAVLEHMAGPSELNDDTQHVYLLNSTDERIERTEKIKSAKRSSSSRMLIQPVEGTQVIIIDEVLLKDDRLNNLSFVTYKIKHFWTNVDAFLKHGVGYVVTREEEIVCICISAFVDGNTHAIDIETLEGHRKRNYAALAAQAYMNECNDRGIRPYWDCSPDNIGSIRLAQGAGLSLDFNYQVYWYSISECMR
ncbi:GNAT family N-acetyltransferase [Paenibacillus polysaccharolyticus]|uniref:GNAT family N-acetyltransferase n=1 Tax=Paenibacillus polysaccharolyticus TaxID=582692 RepID=UPI00203E0563|nr:GNAT family N-acetyltransferase [Paenibacillus polysaccharolyticus]MCM3131343.1 GNAT family N-acetyltransferase [Paenibacillus polysaccharolyticus]